MSLFASPIQGIGGGGGSVGFPQPSYYLGVYSGSDPAASINGQWWYRIDVGRIKQYINGSIIDVMSENNIIIVNSDTIAGSNVTVTNDVVVLPSSTLVIYGSITFLGNVTVLGTLLSSNPNASSSIEASNTYFFYNNVFYLSATYYTSQYNIDTINALSSTLSISNVYSSAIGYITGTGSLHIPSGYTLTVENIALGVSNLILSGTLNIPSGYTTYINNNYSFTVGTNLIFSGTINISSGYGLVLNNINSITTTINVFGSGMLIIPSASLINTSFSGISVYLYENYTGSITWSITLNNVNTAVISNANNVVGICAELSSASTMSLTNITGSASLILAGTSLTQATSSVPTSIAVSLTLPPNTNVYSGHNGYGAAFVINSISVGGSGTQNINLYNTGASYVYRTALYIYSSGAMSYTFPFSVTVGGCGYAASGSIYVVNDGSATVIINGYVLGW